MMHPCKPFQALIEVNKQLWLLCNYYNGQKKIFLSGANDFLTDLG